MSTPKGGKFGAKMTPKHVANVRPWERLRDEVCASLARYSKKTRRVVVGLHIVCAEARDDDGVLRAYQYYDFQTTEEAG